MRWPLGWRRTTFTLVLFGTGLFLGSCRQSGGPIHSTAEERLKPVVSASAEHGISGTIYVPVYSTLFLGVANRANTVELGATISFRNVSAVHPITLDWVRYYDSVGTHVRDYLDKPSTLPPMGSVEFIVQRSDTTGGPGANCLIRWHAAAAVDEPLAEAIMVGQSGNAGVSFSSRGRTVTAVGDRWTR